MSMLYHLALLAGNVMLVQSLLGPARWRLALLSGCGAAMMGGTAMALIWGGGSPARTALAVVGFAGVATWMTAPWAGGQEDDHAGRFAPRRARELRMIYVGVGGIAAAALAQAAPQGAILAAALAGGTLLVAGAVLPGRRALLLGGGAALAAAAAGLAAWAGWNPLAEAAGPRPWVGRGEGAFADLSAGDSGLAVLAGTVGWPAAVWLAAGCAACGGLLLRRAAGGDGPARARAVLATAAAFLATGAMFAPGGLFVPSVTLAAAFAWGMLPALAGARAGRHSGGVFLALVVGLMLLLALTKMDGLAYWSALALGGSGRFLHGVAGFVLALALAWMLGARRVWSGLLGVALAAAAGGGGELLQAVASTRDAEMGDFYCHLAGCAAAALLYLLVAGSRWCESADAAARAAAGYGARPW